MNDSLPVHISDLKLAPAIQGNIFLIKCLSDIDKYFDDDKAKAYLLGQLLRNNQGNTVQKTDHFKRLSQYLRQEELLSYFEGRNEIPRPTRDIRTWVILLFSVLLIILGVVRLIGNIVDVGLSNVYNIPIVREGGFPLISGLLLLMVAGSRWKYSRRRKQLELQLSGSLYSA